MGNAEIPKLFLTRGCVRHPDMQVEPKNAKSSYYEIRPRTCPTMGDPTVATVKWFSRIDLCYVYPRTPLSNRICQTAAKLLLLVDCHQTSPLVLLACCWTARLLPGWRYTAAKWRRAAAKLLVHYCSTASTLTCKCMDLALAKHDGTKPADCSLGFPEIIPKNPPNHFFFLVHLFCGRTSNLLQICPLPEGFPSSEAMQ